MAQLVHRYWYYLSNIGLFYLMAKETFWFKHDYDAADDDKTMLLIEQLGLEGYGIYWILIEKLRGRDGYKMPFSVIPSLARRYMTTPEKMKTVIMQYGLFEYDEEGFFYSVSLIERMNALDELKNKRSLAGRIGNEKRWGSRLFSDEENESIANVSQCDGNAIASYRYKNREEKNRIEEKDDNKLSSKKKFNFKQALLDIGVDEQIASDWMLVRKNKKATNSETAFNAIKKQILLTGVDANECIKLAVERSWCGFKAEWYDGEKTPTLTTICDNDNTVIYNGQIYR